MVQHIETTNVDDYEECEVAESVLSSSFKTLREVVADAYAKEDDSLQPHEQRR